MTHKSFPRILRIRLNTFRAEWEGRGGVSGRDEEELLEESGGGGSSSGEDGEDENEDGPGEHDGNVEEKDGEREEHGEHPSPLATDEERKEITGTEQEMPQVAPLPLENTGEDELPAAVDPDPVVTVKHPDNMYQAVGSVMAGGQNPVKLNQRMKYGRIEDPGFLTPGDERILRNANMCNMEEKQISSASFDPVSGRCFTCLNGKAWMSRTGGPICVVLSDQHFPANIPADSAGECFRILRIENGTLRELADELLRIIPAEGMPKGSVIIFGSTAYLGVVSAECYAAEWAKNRNWLLERVGEVIILPGIPLSSSGVEDRCVIRGLLDVASWFDSIPDPELRLLRNSRKCWEDTYLGKTRRGPGWCDYRLNLVMPVSLNMEAGTTPCTTGDWGERPVMLVALNEAGERYWVEKISLELNREVGLGLATAWSVGRTMSAVRRQEEAVAMGRVFAVGASNAGYTAAALERRGIRVVPFSHPGCMITRDSVENVVRRLELDCKEGDIILIQWLENSCFYMFNSETGGMELPKRDDQDGIFHVTGRVTVSKDMQLENLLDRLDGLLAWSPDTLKVLLCPLVRYLTDCCVTHQRDEQTLNEEGVRQLKELYQLRRALKSRIIQRKYKNILLIDPLACLGATSSLEKARAIMADSFHLTGKARTDLAAKVKEEIVRWLRGKKRSSDTAAGAESKRQKLDGPAAKDPVGGRKSGGAGGKGREKKAGRDGGRSRKAVG